MASKNATSGSKSHAQQTSKTCLCSPTTHPGSFRCSLHRSFSRASNRPVRVSSNHKVELSVIARVNSFKAFLLQIIKPSSQDLQRRRNFRPRPSRFCLMNGNTNGVVVS